MAFVVVVNQSCGDFESVVDNADLLTQNQQIGVQIFNSIRSQRHTCHTAIADYES